MARTIIDLPVSQLRDLDALCASLGISERRRCASPCRRFFSAAPIAKKTCFGLWERRDEESEQQGLVAVTAVFDTSLLVDYLRGHSAGACRVRKYPYRSITVLTWVEVMSAAPGDLAAQTRDFLRGFERLAINEAIADRALSLIQRREQNHDATCVAVGMAQSSALLYVTPDFPKLAVRDRDGAHSLSERGHLAQASGLAAVEPDQARMRRTSCASRPSDLKEVPVRFGHRAFEVGVPLAHVRIGEADGAEHARPGILRHRAGAPRGRAGLEAG